MRLTLIVQPPAGTAAPLAYVKDPDPALAVTAPGQVLDRPGEAAMSRLPGSVGRLMDKAELKVMADALALPRLTVQTVVPPGLMAESDRACETVGNWSTVKLAVAAKVLVRPCVLATAPTGTVST